MISMGMKDSPRMSIGLVLIRAPVTISSSCIFVFRANTGVVSECDARKASKKPVFPLHLANFGQGTPVGGAYCRKVCRTCFCSRSQASTRLAVASVCEKEASCGMAISIKNSPRSPDSMKAFPIKPEVTNKNDPANMPKAINRVIILVRRFFNASVKRRTKPFDTQSRKASKRNTI